MKKRNLSIGAVVASLVLTVVAVTPAVAGSGYQSCTSTQAYGIQTALKSGPGTSTAASIHTYTSGNVRTFYGLGTKNSTRDGVTQSGPWSTYTSATFNTDKGVCAPKLG